MNTKINNLLAAPFAVAEVKWKAQAVRANRALAVAYVDVRCVEDRLDGVFGVDGWQDAYHVLPNGSVVCTLRVRMDGTWIEKSDVGSQSEQQDEGDRMKAAFSDALKRAAVKYGIGRYLYRLPQQWVEFDPQAKKLKETPKLPEWAQPAPTTLINKEQWETLKAKCVAAGADPRAILDGYKLDKPGKMTVAQYEEAMGRLQPQKAA